MAVRLQKADWNIKEYQTVYGVGASISGEVSGYDKWVAKCGREWDKEPGLSVGNPRIKRSRMVVR